MSNIESVLINVKHLNTRIYIIIIIKRFFRCEKKMAKKPKAKSLKRNVNVRITAGQEREWREYMNLNHFSNLSTFVRWCVEEVVEGHVARESKSDNKAKLKQKVESLENRLMELTKSQQDILKMMAKASKPKEVNTPLREYQKGLIINLLQEKPRDEEELLRLFKDLDENDLLVMINELMETSVVELEKNKYKVI